MGSDWGILLLNLGTPRSPEPGDVGRYLQEFLLDPEVIDIPWAQRQLLVRTLIVPFRKHRSAALYKKVWTDQGSPLLVHTRALHQAVSEALSPMAVEFAFRYADHPIEDALERLRMRGVRKLFAIPLYPQYATSATRSIETELRRLRVTDRFEKFVFVQDFHDRDFYVDSEVALIRAQMRPDAHLLFSFHGLPVRQIEKNHAGCASCLQKPVCTEDGDVLCYQRQCRRTAAMIAGRLNLAPDRWSLSYQSRLGRNAWLLPSTEEHVPALLERGVRDLIAVSPGFTADCLETVEELGQDLQRKFLTGGGRTWSRVECLNAHPVWVENLSRWISRKTREAENGTSASQSPN